MIPFQTQLELVHALQAYPSSSRELSNVLRWSHFENPAVGQIARVMIELAGLEGLPPTDGQVRMALHRLEPHMEAACLSLLPDIMEAPLPSPEWANTQGRAFAAHQEAIILSGEIRQIAREGRYSELRTRVADVLALATPAGEFCSTDFSDDEIRRCLMRPGLKIPTGVRRLDQFFAGGAQRGESYHVLGKKSGGKGKTMVSFGAVALMQGYRVFHGTLEDSYEEVVSRYACSVTGLPPEQVDARLPELGPEIRKILSRLVIVDGSKRTFTVDSLRTSLDKLKGGTEPDMVIVDYMNKMTGTHRITGDIAAGRRYELAKIAVDLEILAAERNVVLWTGFQSNREGVKKMWGPSKGNLDVTDYSESYDACKPPAAIVSVNRTLTEEGTRYGKLYLAEHRMGVKGKVIDSVLDWSVSRARDKLDEEEGRTT